ncbi:MAG: Transposase protein [Sphingomonas bacterium]|uniref:exonuclease domain-containing protein n=1 Tax=Sphingomonas bacterium TaxID=1895847 RepID=UPI0026381B43|nr:exonuclease domain-containing protein [Sphingomonas bacterium]MDB5710357.1 Transposase protein [Sphingomonas bacterium]
MRFVAVDVETANPNMGSICQIGLVLFEDGRESRCESMLVNPQTWFDPTNVSIHGIDEGAVRDAKTFRQLHDWLCAWTTDEFVICHTHFDRVAFQQACEECSSPAMTCTWLDSARVARRAWPQFAQRGYGLANVAHHCGITFQHHDALEDARTAGLILLKAMEETGHDLAQWLKLVRRPTGAGVAIRRAGDGDGALVGESIVFTGALQVPRRQAADRAAEAGADVQPGVTKTTSILVVGDQDIAKLNGHEKSSKQIKVEALIAAGQPIRIIGESDFMVLTSITE